MNITKIRAVLVALSTVISVVLTLFPADSKAAATAYLQDCQSGIDAAGRIAWIGTYMVPGGGTFRMSFPNVCPVSVVI